ncbi:uncharacterized protein LOC142356110 [Convolutriloba macropyga]|uniref:uncharacterized protein LOC142356110 n=1 Tax=Convolutriloba macropyga TaxID=536237 RepID=UPI003F525433
MIVLNVFIESGTGSEIKIAITGELGTVEQEHSYNFATINSFRFSDLDPGDLYTIEMSVISLGRRYTSNRGDPPVAVVRNYTFHESTYPVEPTIVTDITVTEHTIHFGWTNPAYFEKIYIWLEPADGTCPCIFDNQSPNDATITDVVAGKEYLTHLLAESAFGRNSTLLSFTRSLYTDLVSVNNTLSTHALLTELEFESGVGSTVEMYIACSDFPLSWRRKKAFELQHVFDFNDLIPGSAYLWIITATSQGSNPLQRIYSFSNITFPMQPISVVEAAYSLESYDTFVFTIGDRPYTDRSTTTIQFTWAQERRIEEYKISDVTLNRQLSHVIASSGWILDDNTPLTPGMKYTFKLTSVSHGKESTESTTLEDSPYPLPPIEEYSARVINDDEMVLTIGYAGFVQNLKVWIVPSEGNCVVGCTFAAPSTTRVELTALRPGMEYTTTLSTQSFGKESDTISITQALFPGEMISFFNVSTDTQVTIEFQLEAGVGTGITLEYTGKYTGHSNTTVYPYKYVHIIF